MARKINVFLEDGKLAFCKVVENLGYNQDAGAYCKIVEFEGREMLVKRKGLTKLWHPHTAGERVQPLNEIVRRLRALDDGIARPVSILEREVCSVAADMIENFAKSPL
jgi:hypothetical protein